jgi:hypothetical protein
VGSLVTNLQAQVAFKKAVMQVAHTSPVRNWFQEVLNEVPLLYAADIWATKPDPAVNQAAADLYTTNNPTVTEKLTLYQMTLVPGTNGMAWAAYTTPGNTTTPILGNWISPFSYNAGIGESGQGWFPRFYRDAGGTQEITTTDGAAGWLFLPKAGLLVYGGTTSSDNWAGQGITSVYVTCYRYIGPTMTTTSGGAGKVVSFLVGDWVSSSDFYYLNVTHNLGTTNPGVDVTEAGDMIFLHRVERVDSNTVRLWVPNNPDLRFAGSVSVFKAI